MLLGIGTIPVELEVPNPLDAVVAEVPGVGGIVEARRTPNRGDPTAPLRMAVPVPWEPSTPLFLSIISARKNVKKLNLMSY
jgi:hypothetical protein